MKKVIALVLAFAMVFCLCACGSSSSSTSTASTATEAAPVEQDDSIIEQETAQADTLAEKVVVQIDELDDFGPFQGTTGDGVSKGIQYEVYQTLANANSFGGEIVPIMMKGYEQIDDTTYEITLEEGIYDSNGNSITASDVQFSIEKYREQGETSDTDYIVEVEVVSDYVVRYHMTEDAPVNAFTMVASNLHIVSQASYEASEDGMATDPVGSGPYKVTKYVTGSEIVLEADENYWEPAELRDASNEMQNVKVIDCVVLSESSQIAMALQTGSADISESVNAQDLASFTSGQYADGHGVYSMPMTSTYTLTMNASSDSPLHDANLRKAVCLAIDSDFVAGAVNGGNNVVSYVMGGPTYGDYSDAMADCYPGYDVEAAKAALAESEYPNGCTLSLAYISGNSAVEDIGVILQAYLAEIGVTLELNGLPFPSYLAAEGDSTQWDFCVANFSNSTAALVNVWNNYFSSSANNGMSKNFVDDEQLQTLLTTACTEATHTEENVVALWNYIMENYWVYALYVPMRNYVYNSNLISGFAFNSTNTVVPGACTYVG